MSEVNSFFQSNRVVHFKNSSYQLAHSVLQVIRCPIYTLLLEPRLSPAEDPLNRLKRRRVDPIETEFNVQAPSLISHDVHSMQRQVIKQHDGAPLLRELSHFLHEGQKLLASNSLIHDMFCNNMSIQVDCSHHFNGLESNLFFLHGYGFLLFAKPHFWAHLPSRKD